jgi:rhodanese-related sulfurtransferase
MDKYFFALIISCIMSLSCSAQAPESFASIEPTVFADKISQTKNPQLIDVRTPTEFASGYIALAKNMDWFGDSFEKNIIKIDRKRPVFIYCKGGGRSQKAADWLFEMGFEVYELSGGIDNWISKSLPVKSIVIAAVKKPLK